MRRTIEREYTITNDKNLQMTEHFRAGEFACKNGAMPIIINNELVCTLEKIRKETGKKIIITSGYRTPEHNKKVNGAENSYHMYGAAADIYAIGMMPKDLAKVANKVMTEWGGIIVHQTFIHIDTRDYKYREGI